MHRHFGLTRDNPFFIKGLSPIYLIVRIFRLSLDCSLRRKQQSHNIKCLNERSKRSLSTFFV